jgi:uroporphyrinogen-III decarboxylase
MIADMQETFTQLILDIADEMLSKVEIDAVYIHEDMAYRGGIMISPQLFHRFMDTHYKQVIDRFKAAGVRIFAVDSDGYVGGLIPLLLPLGVNVMFPFEARAWNDVAQYRDEYGDRLGMIGGLDKFCVTQGRPAIDRELDHKLPKLMETGGFIASLDHRVTIETPFEDYVYYVEQAKRRLGITA